jgi:Xaa-Pro aminopeptidase
MSGRSDRFADLSTGLAELGCEALLVLARTAQEPDLAPFVGAVHLGECQLVAPREGTAHLAYFTPMERDEAAATGFALLTPEALDLTRWASEAPEPADFLARVTAKSLELLGIAPGRLALAGYGQAGVIVAACNRLAKDGWTFVPGNGLVLAVRKRKTATELAAIRAASDATCAAMRAVASLLAAATVRDDQTLELDGEALKVARLRDEVAKVLSHHGCEQPKGNIIAPAEEGGVPHSTGTQDRVLRAGESLIVDLYPRGTLWSDCTRTFCVCAPSETLRHAWTAVRDALETAHLRVAPGVRGWDLQEVICALFEERGYATPISQPGTTTGYVHNLGHGVGFDIHEQPIFKKVSGAEGVLSEGDVFTLEPGLYDPTPPPPDTGYGVRLEDLVWLGPDGVESLTPLPYDLDPRAWSRSEAQS